MTAAARTAALVLLFACNPYHHDHWRNAPVCAHEPRVTARLVGPFTERSRVVAELSIANDESFGVLAISPFGSGRCWSSSADGGEFGTCQVVSTHSVRAYADGGIGRIAVDVGSVTRPDAQLGVDLRVVAYQSHGMASCRAEMQVTAETPSK